jgi:hypothetical protein
MACYVIAVEPLGEISAETIFQSIKELHYYCPIHAYCWAIVTDMTAVQLRDRLLQISPSARIFIVRSGTEAAWSNAYGVKNSEWLKKNL